MKQSTVYLIIFTYFPPPVPVHIAQLEEELHEAAAASFSLLAVDELVLGAVERVQASHQLLQS